MRFESIHRLFLGLTSLLLLASGCARELDLTVPSEEMMAVSFKVRTSDDALLTRSATGLISGTDAVVSHLFMYCFDSNGRYIGRFETTTTNGGTTPGVNSNGTLPDDEGTFFGQIPPATSRIHFVANADLPVGNDKIGLTEEQIFNGQTEALWNLTASKRDQVAYWGYLKKATAEEMEYVFHQGTTTIYLLRDRARIEAGSFNTILNPNYDPAEVKWTIYNGKSSGYVAPYNTTTSSFEGYYALNEGTPEPTSVVTPQANPARDVTDEDDLRPFNSSNPLFAFEDRNIISGSDVSGAIRIIVKVKVKNSTQVLYFPVRLTDKEGNDQLQITRGHTYKLNLGYLPVGLGYGTFEEAAAATSFANGQLVTIPLVVPEVSDGRFDLKILYKLGENELTSTSALYQEWPNGNKTGRIPFMFERLDGGTLTASDFNFVANWTGESHPVAEDAITLDTSGILRDGTGYVSVNLAQVTDDLKSGTIRLQETKHHLERNINIYSITEFVLDSYTLTCPTPLKNELTFTLPTGANEYPEGLFPIKVMIASSCLRPYAAYEGGVQKENALFGVEVRSTSWNDVPGIEQVSNTGKPWNYQNPDNLWNFWYVYTIETKGDSPTYTIKFDDIVSSYAEANQPSNRGLYLRIEFFGDAKAITSNS